MQCKLNRSNDKTQVNKYRPYSLLTRYTNTEFRQAGSEYIYSYCTHNSLGMGNLCLYVYNKGLHGCYWSLPSIMWQNYENDRLQSQGVKRNCSHPDWGRFFAENDSTVTLYKCIWIFLKISWLFLTAIRYGKEKVQFPDWGQALAESTWSYQLISGQAWSIADSPWQLSGGDKEKGKSPECCWNLPFCYFPSSIQDKPGQNQRKG